MFDAEESIGGRRGCARASGLGVVLVALVLLVGHPALAQPSIEMVLNAASSTTLLSPGCWASIYGTGLAPGESTASTVPLPKAIQGVSVTVGGLDAPIRYVSRRQVNALIPFELAVPATSAVPVVVRTPDGVSAAYNIRLTRSAPALFTSGSQPGGPAWAFDANLQPLQTAAPQQTLILYAAGLGPVNPPVDSAAGGATAEPLSRATEEIEVYVGDQRATVDYAGLAPGFPGVYQLNVTPVSLVSDRVYVRVAGWQSNIARLPVASGGNVANVTGSVRVLYPPSSGTISTSMALEAARFQAGFDILPGAKSFSIAAVGAEASSIIWIDPEHRTYQAEVRIPTDAVKSGDFSGVPGAQLVDLLSCDSALVCQTFPDNKIPAARMDPLATQVLQSLPAANTAVDGRPWNLFRTSGDLPAGSRFEISDRVNGLLSKFAGFVQYQLGPYSRSSYPVKLYVDGKEVASSRVSHPVVNLHSPPPLPLPEPGQSYVDPTFGSRVLRVTGPTEGRDCMTVYSLWPTFNADSTALLVLCDPDSTSTEWLYRLDPVDFRVVSVEPVPVHLGIGAGSEWSRRDPAIHYYSPGNQIRAYNINTKQSTLVKDFTADLGPGYLIRMEMSDDEDIFSVVRLDKNWNSVGCVVWRRSDNRILFRLDQADLKPDIDKTGNYILLPPDLPGYQSLFLNILTGKKEYLVGGSPDFAPGHNDMGTKNMVNWEGWNNRLVGRSLEAPHAVTSVFQLPSWGLEVHISLLARDEKWTTVSTALNTDWGSRVASGAYRDQVFQAATDGSGRVRVLAHTRDDLGATGTDNYWDTPRANISFDGRFIAFTSNWGTTSRRDVFVIQVPPE